MRASRFHVLIIVAAAGFVFFSRLGATDLWDEDEAFFAATAAEMHERGDWVVPWYNGEVFAHKPPLMYWMMRIGFVLFGENELGARFFSAVFGLATALLTYLTGRRLFDAETGFWAGLAMSTCLMFAVVSRAATADSYLVFFITLSLWCYLRAVPCFLSLPPTRDGGSQGSERRDCRAPFSSLVPRRWPAWLPVYAAMGLAVLVKGPIGVLLPGMTIGLFLLLRGDLSRADSTLCPSPLSLSLAGKSSKNKASVAGKRGFYWWLCRFHPLRIARAVWAMRPFTAILVVLLVAGPWFVMVGLRTGGSFLAEFFGTHNVGRFMNAMENHRGPIVYYVPVALAGFFPWSIFVLPTVGHLIRQLRASFPLSLTGRGAGGESEANSDVSSPAWLFLACWVFAMVGFFSLAGTKLPNYILPAYPAFALLTAGYIRAWLAAREHQWRYWPTMAYGSLIAVGASIGAAIIVLTSGGEGQTLLTRLGVNEAVISSLSQLWWLGMPLIASGVTSLILHRRRQTRASLSVFACCSSLFVASLLIVAAERINPHQTSRQVTDFVEAADRDAPIAECSVSAPSLVYYAERPVARLNSEEDVEAFFERYPDGSLVTTDERWEQLSEEIDTVTVVVHEEPRFPKPGSVLVIQAVGTEEQRTAGLNPAAR